MGKIFCKICGGRVPVLTKEEFSEYRIVYMDCVRSIKKYRVETGASVQEAAKLYAPALDKFEELTGFRGDDAFHLYRKHYAPTYGEPCHKCGDYFQTRIRQVCRNCGEPRLRN